MENISLLIVTDDKEYGKALGTGIINICRSFMVKVMNWKGVFNEKQYEKYDLILWDGKEASEVYGDKILLLSSDPANIVRNYQERKFCLYKYSNIRVIVSALLDIYSFLTGKCAVNLKHKDVKFLAFASAVGGAGTTTLALAAGQELCRFQGKKVLYLSFEEMESTGEYMECPPGIKGVGVYLYHLFKKDKGIPFIESYIVHDGFGVEAFAPTKGRNPLRNISCDELNIFLSSLVEGGRYDVILMDLGNNLSDIDLICMDVASRICFVGAGRTGTVRETQFLQYIMYSCGEKVIDKVVRVSNKDTGSIGYGLANNENDVLTTNMYIPKNDGMIQTDKVKRILLENSFGENIKRLTEKLIERYI